VNFLQHGSAETGHGLARHNSQRFIALKDFDSRPKGDFIITINQFTLTESLGRSQI
jgi:hypothetical protein